MGSWLPPPSVSSGGDLKWIPSFEIEWNALKRMGIGWKGLKWIGMEWNALKLIGGEWN